MKIHVKSIYYKLLSLSTFLGKKLLTKIKMTKFLLDQIIFFIFDSGGWVGSGGKSW